MQKRTLTDFLIELAGDPAKLAAYKADPSAIMTEAGLSQTDHDLLLSGDEEAVRRVIDSEKTLDHIVTIVFVSMMVDAH